MANTGDVASSDKMLRRISWLRTNAVTVSLIYLVMFHVIAGIWGLPDTNAFRHIHLELMMLTAVMAKPFSKKAPRLSLAVDIFLTLLILGTLLYVLGDLVGFTMRQGNPNAKDILVGTVFIIVLLEVSRRIVGWVMNFIAIFFFVQNLVASHLPGIFKGPNVHYSVMIDSIFMRTIGIYGVALQTISTYVVLFLVFAALLNESGAGQFFIDLATAATGKYRGGPAKAAVFASAGFGTISGSAIANVAGTGSLTIPLMKRVGYSPTFAGAVEAVASTGGQIMPPIMGATAFLMAANVGIPYIHLALFAVIPAVLYFVSVFFMVDCRAAKLNLTGTPPEAIPDINKTLANGFHLLIPIIVIVTLLAVGRSAQYSSLLASICLIIVTFFRKWTRLDGYRILQGVTKGVLDTSNVSVTAATAGIIIGGITQAGLSLMFAFEIFKYTGGILFVALVLCALASLVLGMGMPTTAVYITVATIMAPALVQMKVSVLAAHMFCFYYGCISVITPPVALASFTAAGISGASPSKTGWMSFRIGIAAYVVPFVFAYQPLLLLQGEIPAVIQAFFTALIGCWAIAAAVEGYGLVKCLIFERILLGAAALCFFIPGTMTDLLAIVLIAFPVIRQIRTRRAQKTVKITETANGKEA
jgi:TRAP transporter 4TM/12TM fusion protein